MRYNRRKIIKTKESIQAQIMDNQELIDRYQRKNSALMAELERIDCKHIKVIAI